MVIRARPNRLWASVYGVSVGNRSWNSPLTWEAAPDRFLLPARNVFTDSILYQLTFLFFFQILSYWFIRCKFIIWNRQSYIVSNKYSKPRNSKSSSSSSKITSCHASSTIIIDNIKNKNQILPITPTRTRRGSIERGTVSSEREEERREDRPTGLSWPALDNGGRNKNRWLPSIPEWPTISNEPYGRQWGPTNW